jgi:outer membrane protein insertion porin family/translocation and assembly module TamA
MLFLLAACVHRAEGEWVRNINFDGNEVQGFENPNSDAVLRDAMEQPYGGHPTWRSRRQELSRLDRELLGEDARRVETLLAHHGHFDAEVDGWVVVRLASDKERPPADITGYLSLGPPSRIQSIALEGLPEGPLKDTFLQKLDLEVGDVFELQPYTSGIQIIRTELQERSFAYATVEGTIQVDPVAHTADIRIVVHRGPSCTIGPITLVGEKNVPEQKLTLKIAEGDPYHLSTLEATRRQLFSLRVFQLVNVVPDLSDPARTQIPVRIEVRETKTRSVKLGVTGGYELGLLSTGASARFENWNLFHQLWTWEQEVFGGLGATSTSATGLEEGVSFAPIYSAEGTLTFPRFPAPGFQFINGGRIAQNLQPGYQLYEMTYSPSIAYIGFERNTLRLGYRLSYTNTVYLDDSNINEQILLSVLEQQWIYDSRNDPFQPNAGLYLDAHLAEAGFVLGGDYTFVRSNIEGRTFRSVHIGLWSPKLVTAFRLGGGVVAPLPWEGGLEGIPLEERLYLGGYTNVRGWSYRGFGLVDSDGIPQGGLGTVYGSIELRKKLPYDLYLVGFLDAGRIWDGLGTVSGLGVEYSVGAGVRYNSIAGPIRLDVGVHLGDNPYSSESGRFLSRFVPSLGIGEAF